MTSLPLLASTTIVFSIYSHLTCICAFMILLSGSLPLISKVNSGIDSRSKTALVKTEIYIEQIFNKYNKYILLSGSLPLISKVNSGIDSQSKTALVKTEIYI